ncbi:MAG: OmpH family outer membrane protein, partial [Sediminibacterium sp.]|nr:OmpH family outer membrane protein [Sediminibacterium sp.]
MKITKVLILFLLLSNLGLQAQQRYATINTKYILGKIPAYNEADAKIQQLGEQWQNEIDTMQALLDRMYVNYEAEKYILTEDQKKKREDEIYNNEKTIRQIQK